MRLVKLVKLMKLVNLVITVGSSSTSWRMGASRFGSTCPELLSLVRSLGSQLTANHVLPFAA